MANEKKLPASMKIKFTSKRLAALVGAAVAVVVLALVVVLAVTGGSSVEQRQAHTEVSSKVRAVTAAYKTDAFSQNRLYTVDQTKGQDAALASIRAGDKSDLESAKDSIEAAKTALSQNEDELGKDYVDTAKPYLSLSGQVVDYLLQKNALDGEADSIVSSVGSISTTDLERMAIGFEAASVQAESLATRYEALNPPDVLTEYHQVVLNKIDSDAKNLKAVATSVRSLDFVATQEATAEIGATRDRYLTDTTAALVVLLNQSRLHTLQTKLSELDSDIQGDDV